jgi:probable rRNA maturation factor
MPGAMKLEVAVVKAVRAPLPVASLRSALAAAATVPEIAARLPESAELTIRLTGDRELRRLNREFRGLDETTDVLSFATGAALGEPYLGDLALSWPAVRRQAAEYGHPEAVEAALLAVHGLLHLLGWDHEGPAEEREMWRLTGAALAAAGVSGLAPGRLPAS